MSASMPQPATRRRELVEPLGHPVTDTAIMLGVTRPTIYKLIAEGKLRSIKVGNRRIVTRASIDALLND